MVPTAEVPLTSLHIDEILEAEDLPLHYTAYTPCFRREKMTAGRDVRGIKRGHQFDKVEMYKFCEPENSEAELERMRAARRGRPAPSSGLPYRVKQLCTGDLGFAAARPTTSRSGRPAAASGWRSRRSPTAATSRRGGPTSATAGRRGARPEFVHTLNGSGLGLPRTLIAVLENYQQADGSVVIPEVLRPWMGGIETIRPTGTS